MDAVELRTVLNFGMPIEPRADGETNSFFRIARYRPKPLPYKSVHHLTLRTEELRDGTRVHSPQPSHSTVRYLRFRPIRHFFDRFAQPFDHPTWIWKQHDGPVIANLSEHAVTAK